MLLPSIKPKGSPVYSCQGEELGWLIGRGEHPNPSGIFLLSLHHPQSFLPSTPQLQLMLKQQRGREAAQSHSKLSGATGACLVQLSSRLTSPYLSCDYFLPLRCIPRIATFVLEILLPCSVRLEIWDGDRGCTCLHPV